MARPLTEKERAVLSFLLAVDFEGASELRDQAASAVVVGTCGCGCPTIGVAVDRESSRQAHGVPGRVPVEAVSAGGRPLELLLFVDDGWLSGVELVYYDGTPPAEFPSPDEFDAPVVRGASGPVP